MKAEIPSITQTKKENTMEKESLINALKERIGEPDFNAISRRSIETIVEPLLPMFADDDKITEETYAIPVAMLKSFIGQSRHDIAEGIKSEKARFETEKEQAVKDAVAAVRAQMTKPAPKDPDPATKKGDHDDINAIIDQKMTAMLESLTGKEGAIGKLTDSFNTFIDSYNARRTAETVADIKSRLTRDLEDLGADKSKVIELSLRDIKIDGKSEYSDLLREAKTNYETLYKDLYANGPQPFAGGTSGSDSNTEFQNFLKRQQDIADQQAKDAEALRGKMM